MVFFPLCVAVVPFAEVVFEVADAFDWLLDLWLLVEEVVLGVSGESDDCERTGTTGSKATKTPAKTRGAGIKNNGKRDFMVSL